VLVKASYARSFEGASHRRRPRHGARSPAVWCRCCFPSSPTQAGPLGGEYAARRDALEVAPLVEGVGATSSACSFDIVERFGRDAVRAGDLGTREHRNRPVDELASQSLAIIATALRRADLMHFDEPALELLRYDIAGNLDAELVEIRERPPIKTIAAYRARHAR
jgi:glucosyl-3-phosphoglycerate synthase